MKTKYTWGEIQENTLELMRGQADLEEEGDWLTLQFRRTSIRLYQYWLILNLPIVLVIEIQMVWYWLGKMFEKDASPDPISAVGFMFILYGCSEMLYAIVKKNSRIAQRGFVKFQYTICCSVIFLVVLKPKLKDVTLSDWLFLFEALLSPIVHIVGGLAVLNIFKKNHPLAKLGSLRVSEEESQDFLEQNEAIACEFSRLDDRLNSWPYLIYKWVLKFSVASELIFFFQYALHNLCMTLQEWEGEKKIEFFLLFAWGVSSLFNAYSCFQIETAMRTRNTVKIKRAIVLLKACTVLSVIRCPFVGECVDLAKLFKIRNIFCFSWFAYSVLVPIFGLVGAFKVKKIVEERENFVKVSSYSQDKYI